jgi:hypothetical protein
LNDSYWRYRVEQGQASQPDRVEIERFTPEHDQFAMQRRLPCSSHDVALSHRFRVDVAEFQFHYSTASTRTFLEG